MSDMGNERILVKYSFDGINFSNEKIIDMSKVVVIGF